MRIFKNKKFIIFVVLAILLRLFLMSSTYHPDLSGQTLSSYFFAYENIFNIYDHLLSLKSDHPLVQNFGVNDIFIYPPLAYFTLGFFQKILSIFNLQPFILNIMNGTNIYSLNNLQLNLFILKIPFFIFDVLTLLVLVKLFNNDLQKKMITLLWLFNPVNLYATFSMGVFDIIPVFFTVLSLYLLKNNKVSLSLLAVGIGAAYKIYPIFLLPIIIVATSTNFKDYLKKSLIGLSPLILTNLPFLASSAYKYMVFSPKSQKMLYMQWPLTGAESLYPFIILYSLLVIFSYKNKKSFSKFYLKYFILFFLTLFSITHYHPQWFIWITPFILIDLITTKFENLSFYLILFFIYTFIVFTFDNSLSIGLFAVLNPDLNSFGGINNLISKYLNVFQINSILRSIFAAISLYLTYNFIFEKKHIKLK